MFKRFNEWKEQIKFYQVKENWHKHPFISKIMCSLGRHDYEFVDAIYDSQGDVTGAQVKCFYCLHKKSLYIRINYD